MADTGTLSVPYSLIPAKPVRWLHRGFVPFRHATVVLGPAGTSKGISVLDYGSRMTRHAPMPGEQEPSYGGRRDIVAVLPEDDPNEAVAWRLLGAEAVLDRVHNMTILPSLKRPFVLQSDIPLLSTVIRQIERNDDGTARLAADGEIRKVGMVILDPLLALSENDLRTRGQARPIMEALEALAKKHGIVVLLTHHTNANGQAASSRAIIETARNVLTLGKPPKSPDDSPKRVLTVSKTNIGLTGKSLSYQLAGTPQEPRIEWDADKPAEVPADLGYTVAKPKPQTAQMATVKPAAGTVKASTVKAACKHPWKAGSCSDCPLKPKAAKPPTPYADLPEPYAQYPGQVALMPDPKKPKFTDLRKWKRTAPAA